MTNKETKRNPESRRKAPLLLLCLAGIILLWILTGCSTIDKEIAANNRLYDGTAKPLVKVVGSLLEEGDVLYALGTDAVTVPSSGWSASIPMGTDVGTYYVWCQYVADKYSIDTDPVCITVEIYSYAVISAQGVDHTLGEKTDAVIIVKRSHHDEETFGLFKSLQVDGKPVAESNYTKAAGSLKLTLKAGYLNKLAEGEHTAAIRFNDGSVDVTLTIRAPIQDIPMTGDGGSPALWIGLVLLGLLGISAIGILKAKTGR